MEKLCVIKLVLSVKEIMILYIILSDFTCIITKSIPFQIWSWGRRGNGSKILQRSNYVYGPTISAPSWVFGKTHPSSGKCVTNFIWFGINQYSHCHELITTTNFIIDRKNCSCVSNCIFTYCHSCKYFKCIIKNYLEKLGWYTFVLTTAPNWINQSFSVRYCKEKICMKKTFKKSYI